jgi:hypothetical protein
MLEIMRINYTITILRIQIIRIVYLTTAMCTIIIIKLASLTPIITKFRIPQ